MYWELILRSVLISKQDFGGFFYLVLSFQYTGDIMYCTYSCSMKWSFTLSWHKNSLHIKKSSISSEVKFLSALFKDSVNCYDYTISKTVNE